MTESPKHLLDTTSEAPQRPSKIAKTTTDSEDEEEHQQEQEQSEKPTNPNPRMQRYLVAIEYIGTRFSGSQQQLNCRTVVGALKVLIYFKILYFYFLYLFFLVLWSQRNFESMIKEQCVSS